MELIINGISLCLEFICFYYILRAFLHKHMAPGKLDFVFFFLYLFINLLLWDNLYLSLCGILFIFIYCRILFPQEMLITCALLCTWCCFTIVLVQLIASVWLLFPLLSSFPQYESILGNLITLVLLLIFMRFSLFRNSFQRVSHSALPFRLLFINSFFILYAILFFFKLNNMLYYQNILFFVTALFFLILSDVLFLYYDQKLYYSQKLAQSYEKNLPIYETLISEIRSSQHNYANRLQALRQLPDVCSTYEELSSALKQSTLSFSMPLHAYPLLLINMPLLAASLYNLSSRAESNGIRVQYDITETAFSSAASEEELSDFTTILLQNAIEASNSGQYIYVHIFQTGSKFHFDIRNQLSEEIPSSEIQKFFQKGYSTKNANIKGDGLPHGIGLYYLLSSIQKYHGAISANCIFFQNEFWMNMELTI